MSYNEFLFNTIIFYIYFIILYYYSIIIFLFFKKSKKNKNKCKYLKINYLQNFTCLLTNN